MKLERSALTCLSSDASSRQARLSRCAISVRPDAAAQISARLSVQNNINGFNGRRGANFPAVSSFDGREWRRNNSLEILFVTTGLDREPNRSGGPPDMSLWSCCFRSSPWGFTCRSGSRSSEIAPRAAWVDRGSGDLRGGKHCPPKLGADRLWNI